MLELAKERLKSKNLLDGAFSDERIKASDKRIIGGTSDVNQLIPFKYDWAWQKYLDGCANNWMPTEVSMQKDIEQWKGNQLTVDEKHIVETALGFFSTADTLVANNLVLAVYERITAPECRQYLLRQAFEEGMHAHAYQYCIESLGMDQEKTFNQYREVPEMAAKMAWANQATKALQNKDSTDADFLENLIAYYVVVEGIFFYCGFPTVLALGRQNKMGGIAEQFQYILRDECVDGETELLTPTGWVNVKDINYDSKIAQWSQSGAIDFVNPTKLSQTNVNHVYEFKNHEGHLNQCVSENHRIVYLTKHNQLKVVEAKDATPNPYCKFINVGLATGGNSEITAWERFLIALQADGHIDNRSNESGKFSGTQMVSFSMCKHRKIDRLKMLCDVLGFDYTESNYADGKTTILVFVPLENKLHKRFSDWVNLENVGYTWGQDFIYEAALWDGYIIQDKPLRIHWGNTNKQDIDIMQAICSISGYRTCLSVSVDNRKDTYSDYYRLNISTHIDVTTGGCVKKTKIEGKTTVYGVQVPSTFILIRRHGGVSVTGNSMHLNFGIDVVNQIKNENPELWNEQTKQRVTDLIMEGLSLELDFAKLMLPRGVIGMNYAMIADYLKYIVNRRLMQIGLDTVQEWAHIENPLPWMSEMIDLRKEKNFFETRVNEYQVGSGLSWDD